MPDGSLSAATFTFWGTLQPPTSIYGFDVARWTSGPEVDFGRDPVAPEALAERWAELEGIGSAV